MAGAKHTCFSAWLTSADTKAKYRKQDLEPLLVSLPLFGKRYIENVTSLLVAKDYLWTKNELVLQLLGHKDLTFHIQKSMWNLSDLHIIALWFTDDKQHQLLAYSISRGLVADLLYYDAQEGDFQRFAGWDLSQHCLRGASYYGKSMAGPTYGCDIDREARRAILLGPPEHIHSSWGCKVVDLHTYHTMPLEVDGYSSAATAKFHPKPNLRTTVVLVCCRRPEYSDNYARPNTVGTLLLYDIASRKIVTSFVRNSVSTEILKFNRSGDLLLARVNENKTIVVLNSQTLSCLCVFPHDVSHVPPNHFTFTTLYPQFPVFSRSDSSVALIQWHNRPGETSCSIEEHMLPCTMKSLWDIAKSTVLACMVKEEAVGSLPLPNKLKKILRS